MHASQDVQVYSNIHVFKQLEVMYLDGIGFIAPLWLVGIRSEFSQGCLPNDLKDYSHKFYYL